MLEARGRDAKRHIGARGVMAVLISAKGNGPESLGAVPRSQFGFPGVLEIQFQPELQNPRVSHGSYSAKSGKSKRSADRSKVNVVEEIESLGAEL
jgi:hypothetical protein